MKKWPSGLCHGCCTGRLIPFDHMGLPMARCENCGMEVNDSTGVPARVDKEEPSPHNPTNGKPRG